MRTSNDHTEDVLGVRVYVCAGPVSIAVGRAARLLLWSHQRDWSHTRAEWPRASTVHRMCVHDKCVSVCSCRPKLPSLAGTCEHTTRRIVIVTNSIKFCLHAQSWPSAADELTHSWL
jgi:hypothetical protein